MAIYHVNLKAFGRSQGHSSVAAAAYRAGVRLKDERTGIVHNFANRRGVVGAHVLTPAGAPAWASRSAELWNRVETTEVRRNACVAQELEVSLPHELAAPQRQALADALGQLLVDRYRVAVLVAVHEPTGEGDGRNHHVHLQFTTRALTADGFGAKVRVLQDKKTGPPEVRELRAAVADLINAHLAAAGVHATVDHRSLAEQARCAAARGDVDAVVALSRLPQRHEGKTATALARRGAPSERRDINRRTHRDNANLASRAHRHLAARPQAAIPVRWRGTAARTPATSRDTVRTVRCDTAAFRRSRPAPASTRTRRLSPPLWEGYIQMLARVAAELRHAVERMLRYYRWQAHEAQALRRRLAHDGHLRQLVWRASQFHGIAVDLERAVRARRVVAEEVRATMSGILAPDASEQILPHTTALHEDGAPDAVEKPAPLDAVFVDSVSVDKEASGPVPASDPPSTLVDALLPHAAPQASTVADTESDVVGVLPTHSGHSHAEPAHDQSPSAKIFHAAPSGPVQAPAPKAATSASTTTWAPSRREWAQRRRAQRREVEANAQAAGVVPGGAEGEDMARQAREAADRAVATVRARMGEPGLHATNTAMPAQGPAPIDGMGLATPAARSRGPGRR